MSEQFPFQFENHFQKKVLQIRFRDGFLLHSREQVASLRQEWENEIKKWHSPFKVWMDFTNIQLEISDLEKSHVLRKAMRNMFNYFSGLFLIKASFLIKEEQREFFSEEYLATYSIDVKSFVSDEEGVEASLAAVGLSAKDGVKSLGPKDLRGSIHLLNDFIHHIVEVSFSPAVSFTEKKDVLIFQSKLGNNLMQWHSPWNLLVDVQGATFSPATEDQWNKLLKFCKGLHMRQVLGYGVSNGYTPFPVYRSRHIAASKLRDATETSGDVAQCKSKV